MVGHGSVILLHCNDESDLHRQCLYGGWWWYNQRLAEPANNHTVYYKTYQGIVVKLLQTEQIYEHKEGLLHSRHVINVDAVVVKSIV